MLKLIRWIPVVVLALTAAVANPPAHVAQDEKPHITNARMLRYPDVSATHICFVYAGDIWTVAKSGGKAQRLSTAPGEEYKPRFSPDGKHIAFSGNYDGNRDIYVLPTEGGIAKRLTHHPDSDYMIDWSPDGKSILYSTGMTSPTGRYSELYTVSINGGLPSKLPVSWGDNACYSPDGGSIAYNPWSRDFRTWKRYRGGMATRLWTFNLETLDAQEISNDHCNFSNPMWVDGRIYFICDRGANGRSNIHAYDLDSGKTTEVTNFGDYDVRFASQGPNEIVFEYGSRLQLLDLATHKVTSVDISVVTDGATLRPRVVNVSKSAGNPAVSPTGERAAFQARGDIFSVPGEYGVTRNLTRSPGVAERYPAWSPNGEVIAYWSDRGGEYELMTQPAEGGEETTHTSLGEGYKYVPQWSPDSQKIVFIDQTMRIHLHVLEPGKTTEIDKALWKYHGGLERFRVSWSADSRWFAYSRGLENSNEAVFVYDTKENKLHQVTAGYYSDSGPAFDPEGKYLYFQSGRNYSPIYSDIDNTWIYTNTGQLFAVPLRKDVTSPLATRNDEEGAKPKKEEKPEEKKDEKVKAVEIDFEDFERRAVELPVKPGRYGQLQAIDGKLLYMRRPRNGSADRNSQVVSYDIEDREEKVVVENASSFQLTANRKKMLVDSRGTYTIQGTGGGGGMRWNRGSSGDDESKKDKRLSLDGLQVTVDPIAEWKQLFVDGWRIQRDFFYDPGMHGVDWGKVREQYGAMLDECVTRWDVNYLMGEMIGEINASHTYRWGGDAESAPSVSVGLLGCDYDLANGHYRISRIYDGAAWDSEVRSPLNENGLNIEPGTYLLEVNGVPVDVSKDPWAAFQGLAGKAVELTLNDQPALDGARRVLVTTMSSERRLRYLTAIENTRARVDELSDGKIGYVYVPNTGRNGQNELVRQMRAQFTKEALIIDERWNGGGQLPDRFVELLNRPILNYWGVRDGADWQTPMFAHAGPKAMLINGRAGSGGDAFPYYFKQAGCGKLIGTRTWGGLIGYTGVPRLIDGGTVIAPTFGIYNTKGEWIIEGYGVDPDIEVIAHPAKTAKGQDPELERAIEELLNELKENPVKAPAKPEYPDRSK